ncbi:MAG: hypothetical protein LBK47_03130 [Prevotellaceae bacterium]|nr:hypothetical protein [Prevotellaceae bacterium]
MKKTACFVLVVTTLAFMGCEINVESDCGDWDFSPHSVFFDVMDAEGNNLLDSATVNNILNDSITVLYKNKTYSIATCDEKQGYATKAIKPEPLALRLIYHGYYEKMMLSFGEFGPSSYNLGYHGETFTISWGDGREDEVKFDLYITWKKCKPTVHTVLYFNNKLYSKESFLITIVK